MRGYDSGFMREFSGPKVTTMRERVRYMPAARKAGAMVKQTICIKKPFCIATLAMFLAEGGCAEGRTYLIEGVMVAHDASNISKDLEHGQLL